MKRMNTLQHGKRCSVRLRTAKALATAGIALASLNVQADVTPTSHSVMERYASASGQRGRVTSLAWQGTPSVVAAAGHVDRHVETGSVRGKAILPFRVAGWPAPGRSDPAGWIEAWPDSPGCDRGHGGCVVTGTYRVILELDFSRSRPGVPTLARDLGGSVELAHDKPVSLQPQARLAGYGGMIDLTPKSQTDGLVLQGRSGWQGAPNLVHVQAVPEAHTYALMLAGLGLVGAAVMRRRTYG